MKLIYVISTILIINLMLKLFLSTVIYNSNEVKAVPVNYT